MSLVVRKPAFCICENKDADQLRGNHEADQRLCSRYTDSTIHLLPKSEISSQALAIFCCCTAWFVTRPGRKPRRPVFSERGSKLGYFCDASIMLRKCIYKVLFNRVFNSVDILAWKKS